MSTKRKKATKAPPTGVRYSDSQKKEVVDFVAKYNAANGRGGQSAAVKKYKVTPLTISSWLKAAGVKAPGRTARKAKPAVKAKQAKQGGGKKGVRYAPEFKQQVVDFVNQHNAAKGRGGQNQAAKKFKLSVLTVAAWLKASGAKKPGKKAVKGAARKASKAAPAKPSGNLAEVVALLQTAISKLKA